MPNSRRLRIIDPDERSALIDQLRTYFGPRIALPDDVEPLRIDEEVYIVSSSCLEFDFDTVAPRSLGLYFGDDYPNVFLPSVEGADILRPEATRGVVNVTKQMAERWFYGEDLPLARVTVEGSGVDDVVIVTYGDFCLGCGKVLDETINNNMPSDRRLRPQDEIYL